MGGLTRQWWRIVARSLGLLATMSAAQSCAIQWWFEDPQGAHNMYGVPTVSLPLGAVTYQPPSPIHAGTVLTFTAQLPQGSIEETEVTVGTQDQGWHSTPLLDDGIAPDATANDRVYTGQLEWQPSFGLGGMYVAFYARGSYDGSSAIGQRQLPRLTVLP